MRKRPDIQGADPVHEMNVPMAGTARESVRNAIVNRETTYGAAGAAVNFGVNEAKNVGEAERYDREGYETDGLNIATGRTKNCKFTGAK